MASGTSTKNNSQLPVYTIPSDWTVHLIDLTLTREQMSRTQQIIDGAQFMAMDSESVPIFYQQDFQEWDRNRRTSDSSCSKKCPVEYTGKPTLLQVAIRGAHHTVKHALLFDVQELFDRWRPEFRVCEAGVMAHRLLQAIFNNRKACMLSQGLPSDLIQLKCAFDDECFHTSRIDRLIELSSVYRLAFPGETFSELHSLKRMAAMTLNCKLNKSKQCSNWSRRPLPQALINYAAIDVIIMIDIYDHLVQRIQDASPVCTEVNSAPLQEREASSSSLSTINAANHSRQSVNARDETWAILQQSLEKSFDFAMIVTYDCVCGFRLPSRKMFHKHVRKCQLSTGMQTDTAVPSNVQ